MRIILRLAYGIVAFVSMSLIVLALAAIGAHLYVSPSLPDVESLLDMRMQVPMRVYSRDGLLIAEFGEQRRMPFASTRSRRSCRTPSLRPRTTAFSSTRASTGRAGRAAAGVPATGERAQGGGTDHDAGRAQLLPGPREDGFQEGARNLPGAAHRALAVQATRSSSST
jgi:penicillin-binding protein 1A